MGDDSLLGVLTFFFLIIYIHTGCLYFALGRMMGRCRVGVLNVHAYFNTTWSLAAQGRCCELEIGGYHLLVVAYLVHHTDR
jgi:hypothetical protein